MLASATATAEAQSRGYQARPCGFDLNRDGIAGEVADCDKVCSGPAPSALVANFDGAGHTLVQYFVDCNYAGTTSAGCQDPTQPCKTVAAGLAAVGAPPADTAQVVCFTGTCPEGSLVPPQSGAPGAYTRTKSGSEERDFEYPGYPFMLVGWDLNGDGNYPPNGETALLDGTNQLLAIDNQTANRSRIELGHFAARNYNRAANTSGGSCSAPRGGFLMPMGLGTSSGSHLHLHDLRTDEINGGCNAIGGAQWMSIYNIVAPYTVLENIDIQLSGSYLFRGNTYCTPGTGDEDCSTSPIAGPFRFKNLSVRFLGASGNGGDVFKIWGYVTGIEVLDSVFDYNVGAWGPQDAAAAAVNMAQCSRGWTLRNNHIINWSTEGMALLQPSAQGGCNTRSLDDIIIDRNLFEFTADYFNTGVVTVHIDGSPHTTITNNFFRTNGQNSHIINWIWGSVPNGGTLLIAGNTFSGPYRTRITGVMRSC